LTPRLAAAAQALGARFGDEDAAAFLEALVERWDTEATQLFQAHVRKHDGRLRELSIHPPRPILRKGA
jgi:hypothetical protein